MILLHAIFELDFFVKFPNSMLKTVTYMLYAYRHIRQADSSAIFFYYKLTRKIFFTQICC